MIKVNFHSFLKLSVPLFCAACLLCALATTGLAAPPTVTSGNQSVTNCPDYFNDVLNLRLDMSDAAHGVLNDIPTQQLGEVDSLNYNNGVLSFNSTGVSPAVTLLAYNVGGSIPIGTRYGTNKRIDSNKYKLFSVRMYSSQDTSAQLFWRHSLTRYASTNFAVKKGWNVYSIDLSTATIALSAGANVGWTQDSPEGLELIPANIAGVNIQIDWIQLTPLAANCTPFSVNYTANAVTNADTTTVVIDDDVDLTNGIIDSRRATSAGATSASFLTANLFPNTYKTYAFRSADWAATNIFNVFDFAEQNCADVKPGSFYGMTGACGVSGGLSATTSTSGAGAGDPSFYLNFPSGASIDGAKYRYLTIDITYTNPGAGDFLQAYLLNSAGNAFVTASPLTASVFSGHNKLDFLIPSTSDRIGQVRIDPVNNMGVGFVVNYVSFSEGTYATTEPTIELSASKPNVTIQELNVKMVQPDKRGGHDFAQENLGNAWNMNSPADFQAFYNVQEAALYPASTFPDAPGVNPTPQTGNFLFFRNIPFNGDANYYSILNNAQFDPSRYVNVCFRAWNSIEHPSLYNSISRIIWSDPAFGQSPDSYRDGDDIIMNRGASEYCVDMRTEAQIECNTGLYCPPAGVNPWTSIGEAGGKISFLRIDLNENTEGPEANFYSVFDYITVRTDHETPSNFAIVVDAPVSQQVNLYYNTTKSNSGGTLLGQLSAGRNTNTFVWNASSIPSGRYYIFAEVIKNGNSVYSVSDGRVAVGPSFSLDTTNPVINCDAPIAGSEFDTTLQLSGNALDETRLATVEVKVDGQFLTAFTPSLFNKAASDAYPNYADANYPGFNKRVDTSSVSIGSHTITMTAVDTAGNQTSCTLNNVNRRAGVAASDVPYLVPNEAPISVSVVIPATPTPVVPTPVPTATPIPPILNSTRVSSAKHTVAGATTIKISGISSSLNSCTVSIYGASVASGSKLLLSKTVVGAKDIKKKALTFTRNGLTVGKKGPAKVFLSTTTTCGGKQSVASVESSLSLKKGAKGAANAAAVLSGLKKLKKSS